MEQTKHSIDFHILDCGITEITKHKLLQYIAFYSRASITLHTIDMCDFALYPIRGYFSLAMYSRFYIAELVPDIHKALYIDVDVCVSGDIAEIFNYDLEGYGLGAVSCDNGNTQLPYCPIIQKHKRAFDFPEQHYYFNSGVLLIDCTYWRENNIQNKCISILHEHHNNKYLIYPDQDVLNLLFQSNYKHLPLHCHFFSNIPSQSYRTYIQQKIKASHCVIIHYASHKKPWNTPEDNLFLTDIWWKYASLTPFYQDFILHILDLRSKQIVHITRSTYHKTFYTEFFAYLKYKLSYGEKRKQYKKQYYDMKTL